MGAAPILLKYMPNEEKGLVLLGGMTGFLFTQ